MNKRIKVIERNKMAIIAKEEASVIKLSKTDTANHKFCDLQIGGQSFLVSLHRNDPSASDTLNFIYNKLADCVKAIERFVFADDTTPHGVLVIDLTEKKKVVTKPCAIVKIHKQHDGKLKELKGAGDFIKHAASSVTDVYAVRVDLADGVAIDEVCDGEFEGIALDMLMEALDMCEADLPVDDIYVDERREGKYETTYASWRYED